MRGRRSRSGGCCPDAFIPEFAFSVSRVCWPGVELISYAYPVSSETFFIYSGEINLAENQRE